MSLRQRLAKPLVVEPKAEHTHTTIFLHRFRAGMSDEELATKVLSERKTGHIRTLRQRYPTMRWVFPHPKIHLDDDLDEAGHWEDLSPSDVDELELENNHLPYVTQIILREAFRVGGLDKIIVGGQGVTAVAAYAAVNSLPEIPLTIRKNADKSLEFLSQTYTGEWTEASQFKLAGFVGMHAEDDEASQDQRNYLLTKRFPNKNTIRDNIVLNTPHKFIRGGLKEATGASDGERFVEFSEFLASIGVPNGAGADRIAFIQIQKLQVVEPRFSKADELIERETVDTRWQQELRVKEKYAQEIKQKKQEEAAAKTRALMLIEEDKLLRKLRQKREKERQEALAAKAEAEQAQGKRKPTKKKARGRRGYGQVLGSSVPITQSGSFADVVAGSHTPSSKDLTHDEVVAHRLSALSMNTSVEQEESIA